MSDTDADIMGGLKMVLDQMRQAVLRRNKSLPQIEPRLVCVSKTKPTPMLIEAYEAGQRHFGENYANELNEKASSADILEKCKDIKWHFIGHLQTNKINKVLSCPGLFMVETIHSIKLAENINKQWPKFNIDERQLNVMVQINTSGEDAKNGVQPSEAANLTEYVIKNCQNLSLKGFMTIGQYGYDCSLGPNPDFICLAKCREDVCSQLGLNLSDMELSMGMSSDFEHAIELGATTVRVGSNIFGHRQPKI
ncbi:pyridoxal phosphate homeostasis protein [Arctopsyche grandis]|uniref:pyridoxal phosphate homeostasis protein n=1 Tax=Arctopsyche grandis TaxID=121162 RepID=UPI00406D82C6